MASNNSKSRKTVRRAVALKNFTVNPERALDKDYLARKNIERRSLTR